jgi:hypothetical protein
MSPFIRDGDVITVSPLEGREPKLGTVLAFIHPKSRRLAVHRVVGRRGDAWMLSGDNVSGADGLVKLDEIVGQVTRVERKGRPVRFGRGPVRLPIALLNRCGWLAKVTITMGRLRRMSSRTHSEDSESAASEEGQV